MAHNITPHRTQLVVVRGVVELIPRLHQVLLQARVNLGTLEVSDIRVPWPGQVVEVLVQLVKIRRVQEPMQQVVTGGLVWHISVHTMRVVVAEEVVVVHTVQVVQVVVVMVEPRGRMGLQTLEVGGVEVRVVEVRGPVVTVARES